MAPGRTRVKICGITRARDARLAVELGADALGVNFHPGSPRFVDPRAARSLVASIPPTVEVFGVFVDRTAREIEEVLARTGVSSIQLHGSESPALVRELAPRRLVRAFRWRSPATAREIADFLAECSRLGTPPTGLLIDAHQPGVAGGTGATWDWEECDRESIAVPWILAGGLNAENVTAAIHTLNPYAVDVASGVEAEPGVKDPVRMREFFDAVRSADVDAPRCQPG